MSYSTGAEMSKRGANGSYTLEQVLNRIYLVKYASLSIPKVLLGKRIRLVLVEDNPV